MHFHTQDVKILIEAMKLRLLQLYQSLLSQTTSMSYRAEQDSSKILDLVHFDVLVTLLFGKIPIENILFFPLFQDIHL